MPQAHAMLAAIASSGTYSSHFLSSSLYVLVGVLAGGYALVLVVRDAIESVIVPADAAQNTAVMALVARFRWFWLPAVYALALLVVLMITLTQQSGAGQMMYRGF